MGFPRMSSTPDEMCVVELNFPLASFPPGESCVEERDYIRPTLLAGSPGLRVTGSLLFGSPHRLVRGCFRSTFLFLLRIDGLDVQHDRLLVTLVSQFTPEICISSFGWACVIAHCERLGQYLVPPGKFVWIVLILYYICSVVASSRSSEMDQAGPAYAPSARFRERFCIALHCIAFKIG